MKEQIRKMNNLFIDAESVRDEQETVHRKNVVGFANIMNRKLKKNNYTINSSLDELPVLNDTEFKYLQKEAKKAGWKLVKFEDNYNTTTYKMSML